MTEAVCTGRFLLPVDGHLALVRAALARAPRCTVFIRRAHLAPTPANPFGWEQRARWLAEALPEDERALVDIRPLREHWDEARNLRAMVAALDAQAAPAWVTARLPVDVEDLPHGWTVARVAQDDPDDAVVPLLHALYAADAPQAVLDASDIALPATVRASLRDWLETPAFGTVRDDWRQIAFERQAWSVAPYPVVLVTVDAVVRAAGQVLLIRRGRSPGRGLWALPGGFLETTEPVLDAALRELVEETGLPLSMREMRQALRGRKIFDHPERSQRGRIITHTWFFDLGDAPAPPVQGGDDAATAQWVPVAQLPALEAQLHDDHFHMLDSFLGLLPA